MDVLFADGCLMARKLLAVTAAGALALAVGATPASASASGTERPNIVVILADDLGYADLGSQGCEDIATPNCDSLAANGVRFTNGYACHPVCSPSRAGLLSGRYQHRFGFEHNSGPERYAAENFGLPRTEQTLAERLKAVGYATGMVGKWHIGFKEGLRPHERGFDFHYGFLSGAHSYMPTKTDNDPLVRDGKPVTDEKEYLTDAFAREATGFIDRSKAKPFFLYVAFNAVHAPLEATRAYEKRFPEITDRKRRTYAGMLAAMDDAVGKILSKLREHELEEDTLVFFYSDNGGPTSQTTSSNAPLRGYKGQLFEGGIRVPFLAQWKGRLPAGTLVNDMVMGFDVNATALAAAGVPIPSDEPLDGVDLLPYLTGSVKQRPHDELFWRAGQQHAARVGDWKLVKTSDWDKPMVFHLADDVGEQRNLADSHPEKLKELQSAYDVWEKQMMPAQWVRQDAQTQGGALGRGASVDISFRRSDRDGNGRLNPSELPLPDMFGRMDTDRDGSVTLEEAKQFRGGTQGGYGDED